METIYQLLDEFSISKKDRLLYLAVVKLGITRIRDVAFEVRFPRQTTFSILQKLIKKGLVEQHDRRGVKHYSADPRRLISLIDERKELLDGLRRGVERELPELTTLRFRIVALPKVEYYEGTEGMKRLFEKILGQHRAGIKTFRGYGIGKFKDVLDDRFLEEFMKKRQQFGATTHLFVGRGEYPFDFQEHAQKYNRQMKRLDMPQQKAGCYIVGNSVYLFSYENKIGVRIEDKAMAELLTGVFDDHWDKTE